MVTYSCFTLPHPKEYVCNLVQLVKENEKYGRPIYEIKHIYFVLSKTTKKFTVFLDKSSFEPRNVKK